MARRIRALVVDDSAYNRRTLVELLESDPDVEVVGDAADGEAGLKEALRLEPDVITLDLEMPRMDGFTFLRILMARAPVPVIVVSSYAKKENVFRALELGAVDFVAKPSRFITKDIVAIREELLQKVRMVQVLRRDRIVPRPPPEPRADSGRKAPSPARPLPVVAIGASTGGPPALQHILAALPKDLGAAIVMVQHMPPRFTHAFAERVNKTSALTVREAKDGDALEAGLALLAPGGRRTEVVGEGEHLRVLVSEETDPDAYVPSIDAMLASIAEVAPKRCLAVILTGMGRDGKRGVGAVKAAGGLVVAESELTAVVYGMPKEAADTGHVDRVLPLDQIPAAILEFVAGGPLPQSSGPDSGQAR